MSQATVGSRTRSRSITGHERLMTGIGLISMFVSVVALTLLAVALVPLLWGWQPVVVTSGSMAPAIEVGDIVINRPSDGHDLGPGAVITFGESGSMVTHRIEEVLADGTYQTRGDASASGDSSPVQPDDVSGVGRILVPYVGSPFAAWATGDRSTAVLIATAFVAMGLASRLAYPRHATR